MEYWNSESCLELIAEYKFHDVLWNPKNKYRYNGIKKDTAWKQLADTMNADVDIVKKKIESLRGSYRRERAKQVKRGSKFVSSWFAYEYMRFLDCNKKFQSTSSIDLRSPSVDLDEDHSENEDHLSETFPKTTIKREKPTTVTRALSRKRALPISSPARSWQHWQPLQRTRNGNDKQSHNNSAPPLESRRDECSIFGELVANKLRKLNARSRAVVEHQINNTLFEAEMKYLFSKGPSFPFNHSPHIVVETPILANSTTCTQTPRSNEASPSQSPLQNSRGPPEEEEEEQEAPQFLIADIQSFNE